MKEREQKKRLRVNFDSLGLQALGKAPMVVSHEKEQQPTCSNSLCLTADWGAAIDAQQLSESWPEAYTPASTPPEPTTPLTDHQKWLALIHDKQVFPDLSAANAA